MPQGSSIVSVPLSCYAMDYAIRILMSPSDLSYVLVWHIGNTSRPDQKLDMYMLPVLNSGTRPISGSK